MDALSRLLDNVHLYETKFYCLQGNGNWSYSLTAQDTILFYMVVSGGFCIDILGEIREAHTGDIIMISNAVNHVAYSLNYHGNDAQPIEPLLGRGEQVQINQSQGECSDGLVLIECRYDKDMARPLLSALPSVLPEHNPKEENGSELLTMAVHILELESKENRIGKATMINRMASIVMIDCLRTHIEDLPDATDSWLRALKDPYLAKALAVMHDEPQGNWTIHKLAEVAGMSRSSFAERFKTIVGVPPLTYLIDYRMRLAARYLRLQQHSISRISELVGYASDSTFSQAFKRVYGVSPRSYRQQYRHIEESKDTDS